MEDLLMFFLCFIPILFIAGIILLFNPKTKKAGLCIVIGLIALFLIGFSVCFG